MPPCKVLISNDDGIDAPGLRALTAALVAADIFDLYVCAPSGERSAQSHAITLGRYMTAVATEISGVKAAFAVDGSPADSVMLALNSSIFGDISFDLVVSGINRGDNAGLHVIYSGTVGAAREAACKGVPAIALSLDSHSARAEEDYTMGAAISVSIVKAMLGLVAGQDPTARPSTVLEGSVLNVNYPAQTAAPHTGLYLTEQSTSCVFPAFQEVKEAAGPHMAEIEEHTPNARMFRNYFGHVRKDEVLGNDSWALKHNWVSVTPLGLRQDIPGRMVEDAISHSRIAATGAVLTAAAKDAGISVGGWAAKL